MEGISMKTTVFVWICFPEPQAPKLFFKTPHGDSVREPEGFVSFLKQNQPKPVALRFPLREQPYAFKGQKCSGF
jgi:hypothetical protein